MKSLERVRNTLAGRPVDHLAAQPMSMIFSAKNAGIPYIDYTRDGKKIEAEVGDKDGEIRTISLYNVADKASLEKLASAEMEKYKYSGYRGQLTSFLIPQITPCMNADLTDPTFPSRGGSYYVESVETRYGLGGGRRISTLGIKVL